MQSCLDLAAHFVVDHAQQFGSQLKAIGIPEVGYTRSTFETPDIGCPTQSAN
jgi:hypothetical protein